MNQTNRLMPQHLNIRQNLASLLHKLFHSCSTCTTSCLIRTNHHPLHGITNGTPSAILNAELLSTTTTVPLSAAKGPNFLLMDPPVLNKAISTPSKLSAVSSSTACSPPVESRPISGSPLHTAHRNSRDRPSPSLPQRRRRQI
ncbi:hypothetical protein Bca4012_044241 [Brassica carinata]